MANVFPPDPERDAQRIRLIVARERYNGEGPLNVQHLLDEMRDGLHDPRPIGTGGDGVEELEWLYEQLKALEREGLLREIRNATDPLDTEFWHTSTPVAQMRWAGLRFLQTMEITERDLRKEGPQELLDLLLNVKRAMTEMRTAAAEYGRVHGIDAGPPE